MRGGNKQWVWHAGAQARLTDPGECRRTYRCRSSELRLPVGRGLRMQHRSRPRWQHRFSGPKKALLQPGPLAALDSWIGTQEDAPSRPQALEVPRKFALQQPRKDALS